MNRQVCHLVKSGDPAAGLFHLITERRNCPIAQWRGRSEVRFGRCSIGQNEGVRSAPRIERFWNVQAVSVLDLSEGDVVPDRFVPQESSWIHSGNGRLRPRDISGER